MSKISTLIGVEADEVTLIDASIGNLQKLRQKDAAPLRNKLLAAAMSLIFGVFDKVTGGGEYVGSVLKELLKFNNGGKSVKARTVTEQQIAAITVEQCLTELAALKVRRQQKIDATAAERKKQGVAEVDIARYVKTATEEMADKAASAQEWFNTSWPRVPACMNAIRTLGGGQVMTKDGVIKPTNLAFEQVLLNRAETAKAFAKVVDRKREAV